MPHIAVRDGTVWNGESTTHQARAWPVHEADDFSLRRPRTAGLVSCDGSGGVGWKAMASTLYAMGSITNSACAHI